MPVVGQLSGNVLYFTSLEQLPDPIDWSDDRYLLVFSKPMPLIGQIPYICLDFTSLEQLSEAPLIG